MTRDQAPKVRIYTVELEGVGQRIDNFLIRELKGVPKSRIYRAVRSGEVRVNKGRVKAEYKLQEHDEVRIPPIRVSISEKPVNISKAMQHSIESNIIFEDSRIIIMNKPAGFAVHGGSGIRMGVIEALRLCRPKSKFLDLVHRLDKQTSGCLLIAKKSSVLKQLHAIFREKEVDKRYLALVHGRCEFKRESVRLALDTGHLVSGERFVRVSKNGKSATTLFRRIHKFDQVTLLEALPITGRTHQIRVHAKALGHPIVGDEKYGDRDLDQALPKIFSKRLYLHSSTLTFDIIEPEQTVGVCAVPDETFSKALKMLKEQK